MNEQWFWEQCGGIHVDYNDKDGCPAHYKMPDGVCFLDTDKPDLNHLFKYAVPKLYEDMVYGKINQGEFDEADYVDLLVGWVESVARDKKDPAPALFQALYKAFGGK